MSPLFGTIGSEKAVAFFSEKAERKPREGRSQVRPSFPGDIYYFARFRSSSQRLSTSA